MAAKINTRVLTIEIVADNSPTVLSDAPLGRRTSKVIATRLPNRVAQDFEARCARVGLSSAAMLRKLAEATDPDVLSKLLAICGLPDDSTTDAILNRVRQLLVGPDSTDSPPDGGVPSDGAPEVADPIPMALYPGGAKGPGQKLSDATARLLGTTPAKWNAIKQAAVTRTPAAKRTPAAPTRPAAPVRKLSAVELKAITAAGLTEEQFHAAKKALLNRA